MTADVTPLGYDCGLLCDAICCQDWEAGVGIYLYPGEEMLLAGESWLERTWHDHRRYALSTSWDRGAWFVTCTDWCPRPIRPFGCRTFPLTADLREDGRWELIMDPNGLPICPLIQWGSVHLLQPTFRFTMEQAWKKLLAVAAIREEVMASSRRRRMRLHQGGRR